MRAMSEACAEVLDTGEPVALELPEDVDELLQGTEDAARILTYVDRLPELDEGAVAAIQMLAEGLKERLEVMAKLAVVPSGSEPSAPGASRPSPTLRFLALDAEFYFYLKRVTDLEVS